MTAPSKPFAPKQVRSTGELADLQRAMWRVISRPLTDDSRMRPRWTDGRRTSAVAATIAKANDRLTSFERLEIYNRMYWFRVLDSLYDDCPGLRAVLGDKKFIATDEIWRITILNGRAVVYTGSRGGPIHKIGPGVLSTSANGPICTLGTTPVSLGVLETLVLRYPTSTQ